MPSQYKRKPGEVIAHASVLKTRPELAIKIAEIVEKWTELEVTMGSLFTVLLRGQEVAAFEIFHDLIDPQQTKGSFRSGSTRQA